MDNLAKCAFMARQKGMSYGQYMAKYKPRTEPVKRKPYDYQYKSTCACCGIEFIQSENKRSKYCGVRCRRRAEYLNRKERKINT